MSQSQPFEFSFTARDQEDRKPHPQLAWDYALNIVHYPDPGKACTTSLHTKRSLRLFSAGSGYCESRLNLNRPTPRSRF